MSQCSLYYSLDIASNGMQSRNWGGFGQVQTQLDSITGLIEGAAGEVESGLRGN